MGSVFAIQTYCQTQLELKLQSFPTFIHVFFFQMSGSKTYTTGLGLVWTIRKNKLLNPSNQAGLRHLNQRSWYCLPVRARYWGCSACKNLFFKFIQVSQLIQVPPALSLSVCLSLSPPLTPSHTHKLYVPFSKDMFSYTEVKTCLLTYGQFFSYQYLKYR